MLTGGRQNHFCPKDDREWEIDCFLQDLGCGDITELEVPCDSVFSLYSCWRLRTFLRLLPKVKRLSITFSGNYRYWLRVKINQRNAPTGLQDLRGGFLELVEEMKGVCGENCVSTTEFKGRFAKGVLEAKKGTSFRPMVEHELDKGFNSIWTRAGGRR